MRENGARFRAGGDANRRARFSFALAPLRAHPGLSRFGVCDVSLIRRRRRLPLTHQFTHAKGDTMKLGFVSMPLSGHLNPMTALARRLQSRGHEIRFFGVPDVAPSARAAGLPFVAYGEREFPNGSSARAYGHASHRIAMTC